MSSNSEKPVERSLAVKGQSQWKLIWREFRKRKLALFAAAVIFGLVTASVFAPFLANSLPIYFVGTNRFEYQEAMRTLRASVNQLIEVRSTDHTESDASRFFRTIRLQLSNMGHQLDSAKTARLTELSKEITVLERSGTEAVAEQLRQFQKTIRTEFDPAEVNFVSRTHWPVFASLTALDIAFLIGNILILLSPLWYRLLNWTIGSRNERLQRWFTFLLQIGLPVAAGLAWWLVVPARIDRTDYKLGVLSDHENAEQAPVVFETVVWAPIAYGLDEYDLEGKSAPPVWYPDSWKPLTTSRQVTAVKKTSEWNGPHWLGTDAAGRDVLCRMIWGGRVSLSVGLVAVAIYVVIGIVVGAIAGFFRGVCDLIISRLIEVMICFPTFFLILTIVAFFGQSITHIMLIIGFTGWTGIARLVRGEFLRLVNQEFVLAGRALGYSPLRIIFRHVLPNAMAPVLVSATFGIAGAILTESALSFLGMGISKPTPSWGGLLADGRETLQHAPWLIHFPGIAIFVTITAYNLMGEALRDASDPRLRGSR